MSFFAGVLRAKAYFCCFTQFTVDQPILTVNGSVLSDTPNVRYLVALYLQMYFNGLNGLNGFYMIMLNVSTSRLT